MKTAPAYSVDASRVLKGRTVIAWLRLHRSCVTGGTRFMVIAVGGRIIGRAMSRPEAMLMAIRDLESPRS